MKRQLYCYDYLEAPLERIDALLSAAPLALLRSATSVAANHGAEVLSRVHASVGGFDIGREVAIDVGEIERHEDHRVVLPLVWESARASALFPQMDARLEVAELTAEPPLCQIMFFGSYEPPLGLVGAVGDTLALHRVAEATAHHLLGDVTARLRRELSGEQPAERPT